MVLACVPCWRIAHPCDACPLQGLLGAVGLDYLLARTDGLDAQEEWADSLSLGEQQRLGPRLMPCPLLHVVIADALRLA